VFSVGEVSLKKKAHILFLENGDRRMGWYETNF